VTPKGNLNKQQKEGWPKICDCHAFGWLDRKDQKGRSFDEKGAFLNKTAQNNWK